MACLTRVFRCPWTAKRKRPTYAASFSDAGLGICSSDVAGSGDLASATQIIVKPDGTSGVCTVGGHLMARLKNAGQFSSFLVCVLLLIRLLDRIPSRDCCGGEYIPGITWTVVYRANCIHLE